MSPHFPKDLIDFLKKPASYPHHPEQVQHIQTHISHVFIVPPFVYKFKKPVNFDFLDFQSLDKRKIDCEQEVKLNRRLCDGPYLEVTPFYQHNGVWAFEPATNDESPLEYAVKMRYLTNEYMVLELIRRNEFHEEHLDRIINKLIPFYQDQQPDKEVLERGRPEKIRINFDESFQQTESCIGETIDRISFNTIRTFCELFFERGSDLFQKRIDEKRIVDGHGDLHLEHIHLSDNSVCIYDCIEFNKRFRYLDIASDLAFLAMDLDFNGLQGLSQYVTGKMSAGLDDSDLPVMMDFYKCYRAYVRGKVKSFESRDPDVPDNGQKAAITKAASYFKCSLLYALFGSKPIALILTGRVASGKSTLARTVSENLDFKYYSSDIIRKEAAETILNKRTPKSLRNDLYSEKSTSATYDKLIRNGLKDLQKGNSIVLDATFGDKKYRDKVRNELESGGYSYLFIETSATDAIRIERLEGRNHHNDSISDARKEDMSRLDNRYSPPDEIPSGQLMYVKTGQSSEAAVENLFRTIAERNAMNLIRAVLGSAQ